jgi:lipopolysaccharide export system protein LptA
MFEANTMRYPNRQPSSRAATGLLLLLLCASPASWSLPEDNQQPINVEADRAQHSSQDKGEKTEYFGNVVLTQGSMLLTGEHVTIFSQQGAVQKVISIGKPAHFQQQSNPDKEPVKAYGKRLEYKLSSETITLLEDASIIQDGTTVSGQRIDYNINTEQVQAKSTEQQRVQMILQPAQEDQPPPDPATEE